MPEPAILAFDLGTTRLKVAAFDLEGTLLAVDAARNREHHGTDGRVWQDPDDWWAMAGDLSRKLLSRRELNRYEVAAIGLSARAGGFVAVDQAGVPILPSWSDGRQRSQVERLVEWRRGGAHLSNYAVGLLARFLWLREAEPAAADRVARLLYAKDWLVFRMTGRAVTDPTSGPDADDFDRQSIRTLGIEPALLPDVELPWKVAGELGASAARHLGLPASLPVAVGGHDGICANVGAGAAGPGAFAITIGTHAVVRAVMTDTPPGAYRFYGMPPGRHIIGGNAVMAGRAADWFLDSWLEPSDDEGRRHAFATMDAEAAKVEPGSGGVRFLPFLSGQVAPEARPGASAAFVGLRARHGRAEMYRAVLEGGACAIRAIWDQVTGWCGKPTRARFTGSGALSPTWRQIIVDTIDSPCEVVDGVAEARGAAIYAAVAIGAHPDVDRGLGQVDRRGAI
ncbi:MAG: FGGY-family carbohydrate kinase, partial [Dehalococcoidia bacterium]